MIPAIWVTLLFGGVFTLRTGWTIHERGLMHLVLRKTAWIWGLWYRLDYVSHHWRIHWVEGKRVQQKWVEKQMAEAGR